MSVKHKLRKLLLITTLGVGSLMGIPIFIRRKCRSYSVGYGSKPKTEMVVEEENPMIFLSRHYRTVYSPIAFFTLFTVSCAIGVTRSAPLASTCATKPGSDMIS